MQAHETAIDNINRFVKRMLKIRYAIEFQCERSKMRSKVIYPPPFIVSRENTHISVNLHQRHDVKSSF